MIFYKHDQAKPRYDLIPPSSIKALADVLTYGANKYEPGNWTHCDNPERYVAALYRHLELWRQGEINDSESGLSHLAHAMANITFLHYLGYQSNWTKSKYKENSFKKTLKSVSDAFLNFIS